MLEAVERCVRRVQLDLTKLVDIAWARSTTVTAVNRRECRAAAMLALHLSWHYPGGEVPSQVEATVAEHGRACLTVRSGFPHSNI